MSKINSPHDIYRILIKEVYGQDEACRQAAIITWNHLCNIPSRNLFVGPSGSGKTYIWEVVKNKIYPYVIFRDSASITKTGFSGNNKASSVLTIVKHAEEPPLIVFDEFDKLVKPQFESHDNNVSFDIQSEFLTLIQPSNGQIIKTGCHGDMKVNQITWVFCGSFADMVGKNLEKNKSSGLGFENQRSNSKAFEEKITIQDIIKYGMAPELAGRMTRLVQLNALNIVDYNFMLLHHDASPIKKLEKQYQLPEGFIQENIVTGKELVDMCKYAYDNEIGIRAIHAKIQEKLDDYVYDNWEMFIPTIEQVYEYETEN